ncbi:MAG: macro domain-containing protein [Anaerolineae bacterium]|nr:macro domain-containing protein [Anaerolineae bacterium]MDW8068034.1 macro domain-containing protein [Anaerolineae bacterium]
MKIQVNRTVLELVEGDITEMETDAIVNAANEYLIHGGGVAGAIACRGGPTIQQESDEWVRRHGPVPTGSAAITSGGRLKARYVIHAVGPVYDRGAPEQSAQLLASAVRAALRMADEHHLKSVALPAISTGIFGYPLEDAAQVMIKAATEYLSGETGLERVVFCLYGRPAYEAFAAALEPWMPVTGASWRSFRDTSQ